MKYFLIGENIDGTIYVDAVMHNVISKHTKGKKLLIQITEHNDKKTKEQLGYYFGVICKTLADHLCCTVKQAHFILEYMCASTTIETKNGTITVAGHVSEMDKAEFAHFIDKCIAYCGELGILVQIPESPQLQNPKQLYKVQ